MHTYIHAIHMHIYSNLNLWEVWKPSSTATSMERLLLCYSYNSPTSGWSVNTVQRDSQWVPHNHCFCWDIKTRTLHANPRQQKDCRIRHHLVHAALALFPWINQQSMQKSELRPFHWEFWSILIWSATRLVENLVAKVETILAKAQSKQTHQ